MLAWSPVWLPTLLLSTQLLFTNGHKLSLHKYPTNHSYYWSRYPLRDNDDIILSRTTPESVPSSPSPPPPPPPVETEPPVRKVIPSRIVQYCPPQMPNTILNFSRLGLKRIGDVFVESPETRELYLDDNEITEISSMAFDSLTRLEVLSLSRNNISVDKLLWFKTHYTLQKLHLNDNKRIPDDSSVERILQSMPRLEELSLKRNGISRFTISLKTFAPRLTRLYLSGNHIEELEFLEDLPNTLTHLHLDDNAITTVKEGLLLNVVELTLSGNKIRTLCLDECSTSSLSMAGMSNLHKLNVSRNEITEVADKAFQDTKHLAVLDMSRNQLGSLPNDVFNELSSLEQLHLSDNRFGSVPKVCSLVRLKRLELSNNNIGAIPRDNLCRSLTYLNTILLDGNHISNVDSEIFMYLPSLKRLDLSNNLILNLPIHLIKGARALQTLLLTNNSIANIDELFVVTSSTVQELHLQRNPLPAVKYSFMTIHLKDPSAKTTDNDEEVGVIEDPDYNDSENDSNNYINDHGSF